MVLNYETELGHTKWQWQ